MTFHHVTFLFKHTEYPTWLVNTAIVGVAVVAITLVLSLPAGYALARLSGRVGPDRGRGDLPRLPRPADVPLPAALAADRRVEPPGHALGDDSRLPVFTVPFATWLLMGFFKTIPQELEDAALVDGCSRLKALWRIVFPVSVPGILTVVIFSFSLCVNEFIYAFTFTSSTSERTISAGVPNELIRGDVFFWQSLMAAVLIPTIPLALLYNAFLDRFIKGFTGGAFR